MLRIGLLGSGSKGNSIFLASHGASVLIDAGLSGKEAIRRLTRMGVSPEELTAIVVTHEHTDHIRGVGVLSRRLRLPVYLTPPTYRAAGRFMGELYEIRFFEGGGSFRIGDLTFRAFASSHDAVDPVNFAVSNGAAKVGVATDLGFPTHLARNHLLECRVLILETNHDPAMLRSGPYPPALIQRIQSRTGHLSNEQGAELLASVCHSGLEHVFLAHLSETNNRPEKALTAVETVLERNSCGAEIHVCSQAHPSPLVIL